MSILKRPIVILLIISAGVAPIPYNMIPAILGGILFGLWFEERA